jgi:hypothetical protein
VSEKSKLALMSLLFNPRKGDDWVYEVDLGETFHSAKATA